MINLGGTFENTFSARECRFLAAENMDWLSEGPFWKLEKSAPTLEKQKCETAERGPTGLLRERVALLSCGACGLPASEGDPKIIRALLHDLIARIRVAEDVHYCGCRDCT